MSEPVYLFSYGTRRHIADPAKGNADRYGNRFSLCNQMHETDETMADQMRRHAYTPEKAEAAIARRREEPVCRRCAKKWEAMQ